jgi:hypothetical protein
MEPLPTESIAQRLCASPKFKTIAYICPKIRSCLNFTASYTQKQLLK